MRLRAARERDVSGLLAIEEEAFRTDRLTARKIRRLLRTGNCAFLVAHDAAGVAGYALLLFREGSANARLYGIAVRRDRRGRGFGRALLRAAERTARRRKCRRISLEVGSRNRRALSLYGKSGYARVADLGPYYEDESPATRLAKSLVGPRR